MYLLCMHVCSPLVQFLNILPRMPNRSLLSCSISIAQDTTYRVEMVLCASMEEGTEDFVVITCVLLSLLSDEYMFSSRTCT